MTAPIDYCTRYTNFINNLEFEFVQECNLHRALLIRELLSNKVTFSLQMDDDYISGSDDDEEKEDDKEKNILQFDDTKLCITSVEPNNKDTIEYTYEQFIYLYQTKYVPEILKDKKRTGEQSFSYKQCHYVLTQSCQNIEAFDDLFESLRIVLYHE